MSADNTQDHHACRNQFLDILKKVTMKRDADAKRVDIADFYRALSYFDIEPYLHDDTILQAGEPATAEEFKQLLGTDVQNARLELDAIVKKKTTRILQLGIPLRYPAIAKRHNLQHVHTAIKNAVCQIPGQDNLARALAADLYSQLMDENRKGACHALVHGDTAWGSHELVRAVANAFAQQMGYAVLEVDCSAYRSEGEAASWTGSKSYWSGSGPGEITAFIHNNPRAVICFHDLDETIASVMATLRPALKDGVLIDSHGFSTEKGRNAATPVNCKEAIFLFDTSYGTHWMVHPHANAILGTNAHMQKFKLLDNARRATRFHRGERQPVFDSVLLTLLSTHHYVMQQVHWNHMLEQATKSLDQAIAYADELGVEIRLDQVSAEHYATIALLQQGANMQLSHATPQAIYSTLLQPMMGEFIGNDDGFGQTVTISQTEQACGQLQDIIASLGQHPNCALKRKNQYLDCTLQRTHTGIEYQAFSLQTAYRIEDYETGGLTCNVPKETLDDVHGHEEAKEFLRNCAELLAKNAFAERGINPPRGALLHGKPGSGKTMLARALAGQAQLPFISVTGTMLLDPNTTQKIYDIAARATPCIIHIDEADVLQERGTRSSPHDAAVNMLLAKVDGFEVNSGIFHVLTTNHPDKIEPALLRPGRIDRSFEIGELDSAARERALSPTWSIVNPLDDTPKRRERILQRTYSMTGAELDKLHRELVMRSMKENILPIPFTWLDEEIYRCTGNEVPEHGRDMQLHRTAVHESGHALLFALLFPNQPIEQLSIISRKDSSGHLAIAKKALKPLSSAIHTMQYIQILMAGRAAEKVVFGSSSGGEQSDLQTATRIAWKAITKKGGDEEFGPLSLAGLPDSLQSNTAIELAFERAREWVIDAETHCMEIIEQHRHQLDALTKELLEKEILSGEDVVSLINRLNKDKSHE